MNVCGSLAGPVATHDLAKGMLTGVVLSAVFFTRQVSTMLAIVEIQVDADSRAYVVKGQVFFASAGQFVSSFNYLDVPKNVIIDLRGRISGI